MKTLIRFSTLDLDSLMIVVSELGENTASIMSVIHIAQMAPDSLLCAYKCNNATVG